MKKMLKKICVATSFCLLAFPSQMMGQSKILWDGGGGDGQWCNALNWEGDALGGNSDTHVLGGADAGHTTITVSCNHSFGRIRFPQNALYVARTITIGPDETSDRTLTFSGILSEYIAHENGNSGVHNVFSGAPNAHGARLKITINRRDGTTGTSRSFSAPAIDCPLTVSCDISGEAGIVKGGVGPLYLGGANTHWGTNYIENGWIILGHPQALGHGGDNLGLVDGGTLLRANYATLDLGGQANINEVITLNGEGLGLGRVLGGALVNSSSNTASIAGGVLSTVTVVDGGTGYSSPPTISFSGGGGTGAAAVAIVKSSVVVGATVTAVGSGYTSPPTVTLSGGGGSDAVAVANLASVILATDSAVGGAGTIDIGGIVSGSGALKKRGEGTLILSAANTYTGSTIISNGVLALGANASIAPSPVIDVKGAGIFDVSAVTGGYVLDGAQILAGNGTVVGDVTANGTISPGASVGSLTFSNNLTLNGDLWIEVDKTVSPSNDVVVVSGALSNAGSGTVMVTNLGGMALVAGDSFQLFNKPLVNGQAMSVLSVGGEVWTNQLAVDGSIAVLSVVPPAVPATNLTITVAGPASISLGGMGAANSAYDVYASTNVALPMTNWWLLGTTNSDGSGVIQFLDTEATNAQRFYRFAQ